MLSASAVHPTVDKDVETKCHCVTEGLSECLHIAVHDPSMALYRVQEHVRKSLPVVVEKRGDMLHMQSAVQGACFDVTQAIDVIESMKTAGPTFGRIHEQLRTAMYYKQQLDYERMRRERERPYGMRASESNDSLWQELRKSKSLGHLKRSPSDVLTTTTGSVYSRSTASTPMSEYPEQPDDDSPRHDVTIRADAADDRSSTPTSGADSPRAELSDHESASATNTRNQNSMV